MVKASNFATLELLLKHLIASKDKLDDHRLRDENGVSIRRNKSKHDSFGMMAIREFFPEDTSKYGGNSDTECQSFFTCLLHVFGLYVNTPAQLSKIFPKFAQLSPYLYARQSQFLSSSKKLILDPKYNRSEEYIVMASAKFKQTNSQKSKEQASNQSSSKLAARVDNPLQFEPAEWIKTIQTVYEEAMETRDVGKLGIVLESSLQGTRSIDIISEDTAKIELAGANVRVIGHSKIREGSDAEVKTMIVKPVGLTAKQIVAGVVLYRSLLEPELKQIRALPSLQKLERGSMAYTHELNKRISSLVNPALGAAIKQIWPEQAKTASEQGRPFSSHIARSMAANMGFLLHGGGRSRDMYLKEALNHSSFGSVVNYKGVSFVEKKTTGGDASALLELSARLLKTQEDVARLKTDLSKKRPAEHSADNIEMPPPASKKRNVPAHRPIGEQMSEEIMDKDGVFHTIKKFPRRLGLSKSEFRERYDLAMRTLTGLGIETTTRNLKRIGIGQRSINCFHNKSTDCDPTDYTKE
jgi:hypothetical protein